MASKAAKQSPETAERVRQSALRLFAKRGYEATGIRDVARDAGLSLATLYHYIDSKEDLLLDITRTSMHDLRDAANEALAGAETPAERLAALVRAHVTVHGRQRLEALVSDTEIRSLSEAERKGVIKLRDRYESQWQQAIDEGIASGDFHAEDPGLVRLALLQMCTGVAYWYSPAGPKSLPHIADTFADLALSMIGYVHPAVEPDEASAR
jgi:AcrR family transcriptional regulator